MTDEHLRTSFYDLHLRQGAKMVHFAGYEMPVQYPLGVMKEHLHTRQKAGLFDVSHMGQLVLRGKSYEQVAAELETLIPMDVINLKEGRQRYGFLTNENGGIRDDIMFANRGDHIFLVVNAACVEADLAYLRKNISPEINVKHLKNRSLLALQGPMAERVLAEHYPAICDMTFMDVETIPLAGSECWVSRSGYTGEDGFEISVPETVAVDLANTLVMHDNVELIGLGARDSLRLEAGLCLYGHDIDVHTSPIEAGLSWAIQHRRKDHGGFPGADRILRDLANGQSQKRVGLQPVGKAPMREGSELFQTEGSLEKIGMITSGGFGPTVGAPVSMGYVSSEFAQPGTTIFGEVRGKRLPVKTAELPFTGPNFKR
ncbi:MAG: glycine cleavage system aminomethyltransferase GcvT [Paracoccaceae bacterium]|nr:glycine cleavage system aminomethyltransferase GcvT [Paracoccaceae bacterium]